MPQSVEVPCATRVRGAPISIVESTKEPAEAAAGRGAQRSGPGPGPRRVIKRYSNRKLYDTKDSRYVTLQQIGEMVRAGEEVQIIDNKTKEDKTEVTLALILSEDLKSQPRSVPLTALRDLIQERGGKLWSTLREGTLARFRPGGADEGGEHAEGEVESAAPEAAAPAPAPAHEPEASRDEKRAARAEERRAEEKKAEEKKGRLSELMESSITTLDERIRAIVPSAKSFAELKDEVQRLNERVETLERALAEKTKR
jgi:polyhydroxyalkanoate synthesis repressor PhaR